MLKGRGGQEGVVRRPWLLPVCRDGFGEDLAAVLCHGLLIALCSELSFCAGADAVEAPPVRDGCLLEVVDVEGSSSAADY